MTTTFTKQNRNRHWRITKITLVLKAIVAVSSLLAKGVPHMKPVSSICTTLIAACLLTSLGGCVVSKADFDKCVRRNEIQMQRIQELESRHENRFIGVEQIKQRYENCLRLSDACNDKLSALKAALAKKNATIAELAEKVGKVALPAELSGALADWAYQMGSDTVTYNEQTGIVQFKSDLLFNKGDDTVQPQVLPWLKKLADVLNSEVALGFDVMIVGHTDDIPIKKPATKAKHPTNWHLAAHRAISVENILASAGMAPTRIAVVGMGSFRPVAPNKPNQKGNPKNRRVEIYIVPANQLRISN